MAEGADAFGNLVPLSATWSVLGGIGTVDEGGVFAPFPVLADQNWHGSVVASAGNVSGSARVSITGERGPLARLTFDSTVTVLEAGASASIQLRGWDAQGNLLPAVDAAVTYTPDEGTLEEITEGEWRYQAPQTLPQSPEVRFQAAVGGINAELVLTLIPGAASEIRIPSLTVVAGEMVQFQPQVFDAFDNLILAALLTWTASVGEIRVEGANVLYQSTKAGIAELTAQVGSFEQLFTIDISPAQAAALEVSPSEVRLKAGSTVRIQAQLADRYDNVIDIVSSEVQVQIEPDTLASVTFAEDAVWQVQGVRSGTGYIEVQAEGLSRSIPLSVEAGLLRELQIVLTDAPQTTDGYLLTSGATYRCRATGKDAEGNIVQPEVQWTLLGDVGELTAQGAEATLDARFVGEAQLLGSADAITQEVRLTVEPFRYEIGTAGGNAASPAGISLAFPPDALSGSLSVEIDLVRSVELSDAKNAPLPSSKPFVRLTPIFRVRPEGLTFARPIELYIEHDLTALPQNTAAQIHFWEPFQQRWLPSGMIGRRTDTSLATHMNHLGLFTVMEVDKPPTGANQLAIRHIEVSPPVLYAPEINRATISFHLTTGSASSAEVSAILYDLRGREVIRLMDQENIPAGNTTLQWAGANQQEETVLNGRYVLLLVAQSSGETVVAKKLLVVFK